MNFRYVILEIDRAQMAIVSLIGLVGGAALTCVAPRTSVEREVDIAGALIFIGALTLIGFQLSHIFCR